MGLKYTIWKNTMMKYIIKIRPLWDWNKKSTRKTSIPVKIKIRPLWDWNNYLIHYGEKYKPN